MASSLYPVVSTTSCLLWQVVSYRQLDICLLIKPVFYPGQSSLLDTCLLWPVGHCNKFHSCFTKCIKCPLCIVPEHRTDHKTDLRLETQRCKTDQEKTTMRQSVSPAWWRFCSCHVSDRLKFKSWRVSDNDLVKYVTIVISLWRSVSVVTHVWQCLLHLRGHLVMSMSYVVWKYIWLGRDVIAKLK